VRTRPRSPARRPILVLLPAAIAAGGCAWDPLDAVVALPPSAAEASVDAGAAQDAMAAEAHDAARDDGDAGGPGDPDATTDGPSTAPCSPGVTPVETWTFDSTSESWGYALDNGVQASLTWNGSVGEPAAGSIEFDVTPRASDGGSTSGAWVEYDMPLGNLAGRTVAAWVRLGAGTSPGLKVFAQSGTQYVWADNGTVFLSPQTWTCVSLPLASPSYDQADFDPTAVVRIGFEMLATAPFQIEFDTIVVY
jgi:hypothetical protein